jgi:hypothetical protein
MTSTAAVAGQGYKLEYSSHGGAELGQGVHEREWVLKLDSTEGSAFLEKHRSDADQEGEPIGIFQGQLPPETFGMLLQLTQQVRLAELPPAAGGGPNISLMTIKLEQGKTRLEKSFTGRDFAALNQLGPLLEELNGILGGLNNSPVSAIRPLVAYKPREYRFEFAIANIGKEAACVGDPRFIVRGDAMQWAGVRVAEFPEERPGYTSPPLQWTQVRLAPAVQASGLPLVVKAGEKFALPTVVWRDARAGVRYIAQAVWSDYSGTREGPGCYRVRGAAFSESIEFSLK